MTVFDGSIQRTIRRKELTESAFSHLSSSARAGDIACCALIEDWFEQVPAAEQAELCSRFQSSDDVQFCTAFQEVFFHEFLRRQGCVLDFHPHVAGTSKRPDFLVHQPSADSFILEARTSTEVASGPGYNPKGNRIREFLRKIDLSGYSLGIDELIVGATDLRQKILRKHIVDAIAATPNAKVVRIPVYSTVDGWQIRLTARSTVGHSRSNPSAFTYEGWSRTWAGPSYPLRNALEKKASRYGQLGIPFMIAINSADAMLTNRDFEESLFGVRPGITIAGMTDELARGFWGSADKPDHKRVSGVVFVTNLWPATVLMGQLCLSVWLNPWADHPYRGLLLELPTFRFENGEAKKDPGRAWHDLMGHMPVNGSSLWG